MQTIDLQKVIAGIVTDKKATNLSMAICERSKDPYREYSTEEAAKRDDRVRRILAGIADRYRVDALLHISGGYQPSGLSEFGHRKRGEILEVDAVTGCWITSNWSIFCGTLEWPEVRTVALLIPIAAIVTEGFFELWYEPGVLQNPKVSMGKLLAAVRRRLEPNRFYVGFGMQGLSICTLFFDISDSYRILNLATKRCMWPKYYL